METPPVEGPDGQVFGQQEATSKCDGELTLCQMHLACVEYVCKAPPMDSNGPHVDVAPSTVGLIEEPSSVVSMAGGDPVDMGRGGEEVCPYPERMYCNGDTNECALRGKDGGGCDAARPCVDGLRWVVHKCEGGFIDVYNDRPGIDPASEPKIPVITEDEPREIELDPDQGGDIPTKSYCWRNY